MHRAIESTTEACPICHRSIGTEETAEWVPVCPVVYPEVAGLQCHESCLSDERERNRFLRRDDLRPTFLRRRAPER
jgi:hypothetical protein